MAKATLTIVLEQEADSFPIELDAAVPMVVTANLVQTDDPDVNAPTVYTAPNALAGFRYLSDLGARLAGETSIHMTVEVPNIIK